MLLSPAPGYPEVPKRRSGDIADSAPKNYCLIPRGLLSASFVRQLREGFAQLRRRSWSSPRYADGNQRKVMTLEATEFILRARFQHKNAATRSAPLALQGTGGDTRPRPGLRRCELATHARARKLFNPHRSRSGSVQRILSAMLRPGSRFVPRIDRRSTADRP